MPNTSVQQVYNDLIRILSPTERLRLAMLILNELVQEDLPVIDQSNEWTEQDRIDIVDFSLQYSASLFSEQTVPS
jgi:hypothetical protein